MQFIGCGFTKDRNRFYPWGLLWILLTTVAHGHAINHSLGDGPNLTLVWNDEFEGDSLDTSNWEPHVGGGGFGNGELQYYTDRPANIRLNRGNLEIQALAENLEGHGFTSAKLMSRGPGWKYGRIEVRAKMPAGRGTWPAIWMLAREKKYGDHAWPDNGEIDIVEYVGRDPGNILSCFYTKNFNWMNGNGKTALRPLANPGEFHVYSLEWSEEEASIAIDGIRYNTFRNPRTHWADWPFDQPYYLILNFALGGFGGEVDPGALPQTFSIDYVRVYQ